MGNGHIKILVFGGSGFLGSYLVEELLKRNYQVTIADIRKGHEDFIPDVKFVDCDIYNKEDVRNTFDCNQFDVVYNFAGFASLDEAIKNPLRTFELNVIGNMNIIENCVTKDISKYVYASSAYAMSNKGSFYGISKLASEKIVEEYQKRYNLNFIILRYGSVYSEKPYGNNYIYNLIEKALKTGEINHGGDGKEVREYIHAADAAKLSVDVIENNEYINKHVILTGVERMQRYELFSMINEILGDKLKINYNLDGYSNHYKMTPYSFEPSVCKKLISNPHIDMGQGLLECIRAVNAKRIY